MRSAWLGRGLAATLVAAGLLLALPHRVDAHARILSVLPAPASTVPGPVAQMLLHYNEPIDKDLFRLTVEGDRGSELAGKPVFKDDETIVASLRPDAAGYLVVTWVAVGLDAHPVVGQYYFAIRSPNSKVSLGVAPVVSSFESGGGAGGLTALIEAARAMEIVLLYAVLGIVFIGALLWQRRRTQPAAGPGAAVYAGPALMVPTVPVGRAYRVLLIAGTVSVALMPLLFWLNAERLSELLIGVGIPRIVASSIGLLCRAAAAGARGARAGAGGRLRRGHPRRHRQRHPGVGLHPADDAPHPAHRLLGGRADGAAPRGLPRRRPGGDLDRGEPLLAGHDRDRGARRRQRPAHPRQAARQLQRALVHELRRRRRLQGVDGGVGAVLRPCEQSHGREPPP
ncbi:MAG: copper resistance protein CopC [Chloroflexi bacterium]|nr:MAG: copper resistance protein CopC [Chloroflexota bacterium]